MNFSFSDEMINTFMIGFVIVLALVVVGCILALILGGMSKRFPFTRLALVLALSPLALMRFLDYQAQSTLVLFAMIAVLIGITVDGIGYLLAPRSRTVRMKADEKRSIKAAESNPSSKVIELKKAK